MLRNFDLDIRHLFTDFNDFGCINNVATCSSQTGRPYLADRGRSRHGCRFPSRIHRKCYGEGSPLAFWYGSYKVHRMHICFLVSGCRILDVAGASRFSTLSGPKWYLMVQPILQRRLSPTTSFGFSKSKQGIRHKKTR